MQHNERNTEHYLLFSPQENEWNGKTSSYPPDSCNTESHNEIHWYGTEKKSTRLRVQKKNPRTNLTHLEAG